MLRAMTTVKCPTCAKSVVWDATSPWRPFCSERCKLIDLGAWADGTHAIAGEPVDEQSLELLQQQDHRLN